MSDIELFQISGAGAFGAIIGWFVYYINRYRTGEVSFADITTLIGAIGGAGVLALFNNNPNLFAGYGIGLFIGFFSYFIALNIMINRSENFDVDWFLDGRRKRLSASHFIPGNRQETEGRVMTPMSEDPRVDEIHGRHPAAAPNVVVTTSGDVTVDGTVAVDQPQNVPAARAPGETKPTS